MARLGFAYYGNPYKNETEKGNKIQLAGGLGYRNKGMFIDLAYVHTMGKDIHYPYRLQNGFSPMAKIESVAGNVVATLGIKF